MALKAVTRRSNNAFLISLSLHLILAIFLAVSPMKHYIRQYGSAIAIDWVKDVPDPELKRELPKQPIEMKFDPTRLDLDAKKKASKASSNKMAWVKERSNRLVERSVELNDADRSDTIPDIMTAAQVRNSATNLSGMISTDVGPIDGKGILSNQVRAAGKGGKSGVSLLGLGGEGDGLLGGGGGGGIIDRLGIINFMNEADGPQKVV